MPVEHRTGIIIYVNLALANKATISFFSSPCVPEKTDSYECLAWYCMSLQSAATKCPTEARQLFFFAPLTICSSLGKEDLKKKGGVQRWPVTKISHPSRPGPAYENFFLSLRRVLKPTGENMQK